MVDDSKFGQKLMEKMGWEKGKGLGADSQGNVDPVAVKQKNDNKGIGFQGHDDTWIAHQDDFAAVLAKLNEEHGGAGGHDESVDKEKDKKSLEESSKKAGKRVQ